jgi:internalin A
LLDLRLPQSRYEANTRDENMPPDLVFISYSHEDTKWREELEKHLKPYLRASSIKSWSDKQISSGTEWLTEIKAARTNTKVAVLLVTPDFIASDFVHEYELGPFLKEAKQGGVRILSRLVPTKKRRSRIIKLFWILSSHWLK